MRPFGMDGSRKLSDILVDAKVPARRRPLVPIVRDGERIVWVAGVKSSEDYRVGPDTQRTVRLVWQPRRSEGTS
jgi:tRNA(Ile)-lysidine synthetase-like protein